jgi:hypothetical protein
MKPPAGPQPILKQSVLSNCRSYLKKLENYNKKKYSTGQPKRPPATLSSVQGSSNNGEIVANSLATSYIDVMFSFFNGAWPLKTIRSEHDYRKRNRTDCKPVFC